MYIGQKKGMITGPPFAAYYNMDMQDLDVEIGFPVEEHLPSEGDIQQSEIPQCKAATCIHTGPYEKLVDTYEQFTVWMKEQSVEPQLQVYEFYLNDPQQTPAEGLQTKILFPLKT